MTLLQKRLLGLASFIFGVIFIPSLFAQNWLHDAYWLPPASLLVVIVLGLLALLITDKFKTLVQKLIERFPILVSFLVLLVSTVATCCALGVGLNRGLRISKKYFPNNEPFTVSVEWARFSIGGKEYGTSLWARYPSRSGGCGILSPIRGIYFLSIKNNRSVPVSVVGYTIDVMGQPLVKVLTGLGTIVGTPNSIDGHFFHPRLNVSNLRPGQAINIGQGPGFSMVQVPINQSDYSRAINLKMDLIDDLLKKPLQPGIPIRGWTFFQPKNENAFTIAGPGHVTLETDDSKTFSYDFNLRNPHPELDNMDRIIRIDSFVDLSDCEHP